MKEIANAVAPVLVQVVIAILVVVIPLIARIVIKYLKAKLVEVENRIGKQNYDAIMTVAEDIFFEVEQKYINGLIKDKREEFDKLLLAKVPSLTQNEIDRARESIVGKINSYLK